MKMQMRRRGSRWWPKFNCKGEPMLTQKERTAKYKEVLNNVIQACRMPGLTAPDKLLLAVELLAHLMLWEIEQEDE